MLLLKREVVGFVLAPTPADLPLTLLFGNILLDRPYDSASVIEAWLQTVIVSYGACLSVGVPIHFVLRRLGRCSLLSYLLAVTGAVAAAAISTHLFQSLVPSPPEANPFGFTLASRAGVAAAIAFEGFALAGVWIFWRIAVRAPDGRTTASRQTVERQARQ